MKRHLLSTLALVVTVLFGSATSFLWKDIQADIRQTQDALIITNLDEFDWEDAVVGVGKRIEDTGRFGDYISYEADLGVVRTGERRRVAFSDLLLPGLWTWRQTGFDSSRHPRFEVYIRCDTPAGRAWFEGAAIQDLPDTGWNAPETVSSASTLLLAVLAGTAMGPPLEQIRADIRRTEYGLLITNRNEFSWRATSVDVRDLARVDEDTDGAFRLQTILYQAELGPVKAGERRTVWYSDLQPIEGATRERPHFDSELHRQLEVRVTAAGPYGGGSDGGMKFEDLPKAN